MSPPIVLYKMAFDFRLSSLLDNVIVSMTKEVGLIDHQLNRNNDFYTAGIFDIFDSTIPISVTMKPTASEANLYDSINFEIYFKNVILGTPSTINVAKDAIVPMFPTETLAKRQTYASNVRCDIYCKITGTKNGQVVYSLEKTLDNRSLCTTPILVGSIKCNTFGLSKEGMRLRNEDPNNVGGYYIIKGQEYYVNITEASAPNITKIFRGNKSDNYLAKTEFTSKDGFENQIPYRVTTLLGKDKVIYVVINCGIFRNDVRIPLPIFIAALGLTQPFKEIISKISYGQESIENICQTCWYKFEDMLHNPEGRVRYAREYIANLIPDAVKLNINVPTGEQEFIAYVASELIRNFENCCFTVVGKSKQDSFTKLDYVYRMTYWTISAGLSPTNELIDNRDISVIKRFVSPAATISKVTKTVFRNTIVPHFRAEMRKEMDSSKLNKIDPEKLFKNDQKDIATDFQKSITQTINAGGNITNKDGNVVAKGQMKIGMAMHKNKLCIMSQARGIDGNSFGDNAVTTSSRNKEFRRNEQSLTGGICPIHSATESTNVGTKKQLAVSSRITHGESDQEIIDLLYQHGEELGLDFVDPLYCNPLYQTIVYCNGKVIAKTLEETEDGVPVDTFDIIRLFNRFKRENKIPKMTSITYSAARNEINFFTDGGRLVRPVIPVVRTITTKKGIERDVPGGYPGAVQRVEITPKDLDPKTVSFSDLLAQGKVVYLSTDEAPTYRVATSYEEWIESLDSPVDHFDFIEIPSGIFSLAVSTKPFLRHDQVARTVYQSSQSRQTAGRNVDNIHLRYDKEMVRQFYTGKATVCTMYRELGMEEYGENVTLAVVQSTGDNQEDSVIIKKGSVDCGMFSNDKYDARRIPVDSKEILGVNEQMEIASIKGSNTQPFKHIDPSTGIAKRNTRVGPEPVVLVAKSIRTVEQINGVIKQETKNKSYSASNKYEIEYVDHSNKCEIDKVTHVQISTVKSRNLEIGDKVSTRAGQKGIIGRICENNEMPYTLDGDQPDILINPHHQNTRRTIGMIYEGIFAMIGSKLGIYIKGTTVPEPAFFKDASSITKWVDEELRPQYRNYPKAEAEQYIQATVAAIGEIRKQLEDNNWDTCTMVSGLNGEIIKGEVTVVRIFYQRLLKVVKDAFYVAPETVNYDIHFRQPDAGAKNGGGLRNGEMETGNLMGHGSANFLAEKTHIHSDGIVMQLCRCGRPSNYNYETKTGYCHNCRENTDLIEIQSAFSTQLLVDKLAGTGISLTLVPEKYKVYDIVKPVEGE